MNPEPKVGEVVKLGFNPVVTDEIKNVINSDYEGMFLVETSQGHTCWIQFTPASSMFTLAYNHAHPGMDARLKCNVCNPLGEGLVLPPLKSRY